MKIKNIMFSGVMAAILMTVAGNASAADVVSVASTGYVDAKVEGVETNITNNYVSNTQLAEKVTTVIESAESGKLSQIDDVVTLVGDETSGLVADVDALEGKVGDKAVSEQIADKVGNLGDGIETVGAALELKADKTDLDNYYTKTETFTQTEINEAIGKIQSGGVDLKGYVKESTYNDGMALKADKSVVDTITASLAEGGDIAKEIAANKAAAAKNAEDIATNAQGIADNKAAIEALDTTYVKDSDFTSFQETNTTNIADAKKAGTDAAAAVKALEEGAVATNTGNISTNATNIGTNADAIAKLNSAASVEGSVAHTVEGYAVPKPGENCSKTTCVLTVDQETNVPYWMELALSVQP